MLPIKGVVTFFVNFPETKLPEHYTDMLSSVKNYNAECVDYLKQDGYVVMFVPVLQEASRVEIIDFAKGSQ